jgi:serine phosphatase RsbU (regulator of sigma subunit)
MIPKLKGLFRNIGVVVIFFLGIAGPLFGLSDFYWEQPDFFIPQGGDFPVSAFNGGLSILAWQEAGTDPGPERGDGQIYISLAVKESGRSWDIHRSVGGPYPYSGSEPAILSVSVDDQGRILMAAAASTSETEILLSDDQGESFTRYRLHSGAESSIAPRIFSQTGGGYLLFITRGRDQSLSIYYAHSSNGSAWTSFEPFVQEPNLQLNFLPSHRSFNGIDYVVFQSFVGSIDVSPAFQLFLKSSADGGISWTPAKRITEFRDPFANTDASPDRFDNQRPHLSLQGDQLFLVWERRFGAGNPQIYGAALDAAGNISGVPERINSEDAYCNNPVAFYFRGEATVVWFDNRRGENRIFLAQRWGINWQNNDLSGSSGEATFARPVVDGNDLLVFWQTRIRGMDHIYSLVPDTTVAAPRLSPLNFFPSQRTRGERVRVSWNVPTDSSGIIGFSYCWSRSSEEVPSLQIRAYAGTTSMEVLAEEDGSWYFSLIAQDFAGNWSAPSVVEYIRDTTPPPAATVILPVFDEEGFLPANSFSIRWNPPPASDVAGYTWTLERMAPLEAYTKADGETFISLMEEHFSGTLRPPPRIMGVDTEASFTNQDNGVWRFSVFAIDEVGNIGPPSSAFFRMNKYIPHTYITVVDALQDDQGILSIRIIGRGFTDSGSVVRVFLDRDGLVPYDREYFLSREEYQIPSDREIRLPRIDDIDEGIYRVGVEHPVRGIYFTGAIVTVDEMGTVKFGDYTHAWESSWTLRPSARYRIDMILWIIIGIVILCGIGLAASVRGIGSVIADSAALQLETTALITGDPMPVEKNKWVIPIKKRRLGLRLKLASFTIALVLLVVILVAAPLYYNMTRTQEETLLKGLWDRSTVLMEGLASSARAYLPAGNVLELGFLPAQSAVLPEARYVTITGFGSGQAATSGNHVWATNDPDILHKIDTAEFQPGISRIEDVISPRLETLTVELDEQARASVGDITQNISSLTWEALSLALRSDQDSLHRLEDIQYTTRGLETRLTERLTGMAREIRSEPAFSTRRAAMGDETSFIFFKPVMFRQGSEDVYFRGLIRLEVSIDSIITQIAEGQSVLLRVLLVVALTAILIGAVGAMALSMVIIQPIKKLAAHVERIRDTEDKAKLAGVEITIKSRDEIALLGNSINDMTHGLVKAALASQDLTIGKEVQKKFIPLETDKDGNKLTSGFKDTKNAQFFGYYEGAKGVSGDYFDYQDLDGRYFAIIKCDVAGKGIPAALIMIQVATMFLNYFKDWKPTQKGMHIEDVVYQINDFIETLAFKGRFAAFSLALFDSETGIVRFCNAGDNIIHLYDASEGMMKTLTLPQSPATGVLPNFMVESKGGYQVQTMTIDHGDILLLYTDGIEEAKRKFRDAGFKEILCTEGSTDTPHANHVVGQGDEELGADRVEAIINAVMNRQAYTLYKYHNPEGEIELHFDFSSCKGTVEEAIMAMVSVEKMFRLYKAPDLDEDARVLTDKKVDAFLREHFRQYRKYCSQTRDNPGNEAYIYYTNVQEDEQYDDLTIIGIHRK